MHKNLKPFENQKSSKKEQVTQMFDQISKHYDGLNRIITLGIDLVWRKRMVKLVANQKPINILDIATGTADLAIALNKTSAKEIIGFDPNIGLEEGLNRCLLWYYNLGNNVSL